MIIKKSRNDGRIKRHKKIRLKIFGTENRPRLSVFRSNSNIFAQIINDEKQHTLVSASTLDKSFSGNGGNKLAAQKVGKMIAERAIAMNISKVVFDRSGYIFHGRIKELADSARENGLKF